MFQKGKKPKTKHDLMIDLMMATQKVICEYCGKVKDGGFSFVIGASNKPDWVMVEGTGKMSCPDCLPKAEAEARAIIERL